MGWFRRTKEPESVEEVEETVENTSDPQLARIVLSRAKDYPPLLFPDQHFLDNEGEYFHILTELSEHKLIGESIARSYSVPLPVREYIQTRVWRPPTQIVEMPEEILYELIEASGDRIRWEFEETYRIPAEDRRKMDEEIAKAMRRVKGAETAAYIKYTPARFTKEKSVLTEPSTIPEEITRRFTSIDEARELGWTRVTGRVKASDNPELPPSLQLPTLAVEVKQGKASVTHPLYGWKPSYIPARIADVRALDITGTQALEHFHELREAA